MTRDQLTNEQLKNLFKSNFELAKYAMEMARYQVAAGQETTVEDILDDIIHNPRQYSFHELSKMIEEAKSNPHAEEESAPEHKR